MTIEEIARKMTEAQRRAVVDTLGGDGMYVTRWKYGRSVRVLYRMGLTYAPPPGPGGLVAVLTPLGEQVRTHLQSRQP